MKISLYKMLLGCAAVFGLAAVGCDDQVTQSDVNAARDEVRDEAKDVKEAQNEAREEVAEEQGDVAEVVREENAEIAEERDDLAEAQAEAAKVEQEFVNQEQRKAYIEQQRAALNDADAKLDVFEGDVAKIEDDATHDAREREVQNIRDLYDAANDKFGDLDATDEDGWRAAHNAFAGAMQRLQVGLNKLGNAAAATIDPATPVVPAPVIVP